VVAVSLVPFHPGLIKALLYHLLTSSFSYP
jgi:hypothetical protein